jgi:SAM-dependent methyltransferase/MFS family permease
MKPQRYLALHYGLTIFLSAFLLFQVQPIIGKMILPWFGGSASVWTTCMLFFQMVLLLGYFYSHWVVRYLTPRQQSLLHIALLLASLLMLPLAPSADWRPTGGENPTLRILGLLTVSIGLPYFVLSTTGPLVQAWFARERSGAVPYRLFALSNFGSMLALLAYPVAVEPVLPTRWQSWLWSGLFVGFGISCALLAWRGRHGVAPREAHGAAGAPLRTQALWAALAACPSILMVADTSYLTENIAPIPLLWILPLAIYLLSFILCFERSGWYQRTLFLPLLALGLSAMAYLPTLGMNALPVVASLAINLTSFFVACMVCHGELARLKPHPSQLTGYYLMLAVGGAIGGLFVGVVAPYCFNSNYELSVGIVLTALVVAVAVVGHHHFVSLRRRGLAWAGAVALVIGLGYVRIDDHISELEDAKVTMRNFYGTLRVFEGGEGEDAYRTMMHGQIIHGRQYRSPDRLDDATTYYSAEAGVGRAIQALAEQGPLRVGVIGLGVGTLARWGRPDDYFRIYEIDPLVLDLAHTQFSFLSRSKARVDTVLGDARLSLENEPAQHFDLLVVDAFSGDAVPVHLLTREAFAAYFKQLKPDGMLALHVTNRFLNLEPVVKMAAESFHMQARRVEFEGDRSRQIFHSSWVLVSRNEKLLSHPLIAGVSQDIPLGANARLWRDDYSSVFSALK